MATQLPHAMSALRHEPPWEAPPSGNDSASPRLEATDLVNITKLVGVDRVPAEWFTRTV